MVSPFEGYLSAGGASQVIHRLVIQFFLSKFETALPPPHHHPPATPRTMSQLSNEIWAQLTLLQERTSCTGGRGGVDTEPFTSSSQLKRGGDISEPLQHLKCSLILKALMPGHLINEFLIPGQESDIWRVAYTCCFIKHSPLWGCPSLMAALQERTWGWTSTLLVKCSRRVDF